MKKFLEYPSIEQFRNVIKELSHAEFIGLDENGEKLYDRTRPKPIAKFKGTVKLHGTNACVAYRDGDMWIQSRSQIITPQNDNAGFSAFVMERKSIFENIFNQILMNNPANKAIYIFGEFVGQDIQKGVAISNLPKSFFIFDICLADANQEEINREWIDIKPYRDTENKIYNIEDYPTWEIEIDFNNPGAYQNRLIEITDEVENECPVGKAFGFSGIGEGVVWRSNIKGHRHIFKVKGKKHSVSKVKTLANVDVEKLNSINEFCDYAVTENRLNQAIENVFGSSELSIKLMGEVIRWMVNDIHKEESDTLSSNNLTDKDVNKSISDRVRVMFGERLNQQAGLSRG